LNSAKCFDFIPGNFFAGWQAAFRTQPALNLARDADLPDTRTGLGDSFPLPVRVFLYALLPAPFRFCHPGRCSGLFCKNMHESFLGLFT
jgi:hypothetical protein